MNAEIRTDGMHISGYVNVPGRESRPVATPRGRVVEVIEQNAFKKAINKAQEIRMLLDHNHEKTLATTKDGTLNVCEDEIGLRAEAVVNDQETIDGAKAGKLKGWSFNMKHVVDEMQDRENELPLRKVKEFDMDEITLVMNKTPVYSATSLEVRAGEEENIEYRAYNQEVSIKELEGKKKENFDNSCYKNRLQAIKSRKE